AESLAADDAAVDFEVNGVIFGHAAHAPHEIMFTVPAGVEELVFRAIVQHPSGAVETSRLVRMPVMADSGVPLKLPTLAEGEEASLFAGGLKAEYFQSAQPLAERPSPGGLEPQRTGFVTAVN